MQQQQIPLGFISNFVNALGRTAMQQLLHKVFGSPNIRSVNVGGSSAKDMPSSRKLIYEVIQETASSSSESSSSDSSPIKSEEEARRASPRVKKCLVPTAPEEAKTFTKTFIPDTVLDHDNTELLCVEIKRAHFDTSSVPQLQYLLIPAAMKNGVAFGLLICTKNAILMKCYTNTVPKKRVMFQAAHFTL